MNRVLAVLAAGFLLCGAAKDESPAQGPRIRVEPEGFDFGRTLPLQTLRKEFRLRNAGDQDLVLQDVRTSCGCTAAIVGKTTLAPGGSTPLSVSLKTGGSRGRIVKSVLVPSNDPKTPLLEIKIEATVEQPRAK
jgi:hypothetical protein